MYTALIIDRSPAAREQLLRVTEAAGLFGRLLTAPSDREAFEVLQHERVDLVAWDWRPETMEQGQSFFRRLKTTEEWADIPVLAFTSAADEETQILALENGADDCYSYHASPSHVVARMRLHLRRKERAEGLRAERLNLARLAATDKLTGLYNRGFFDSALEAEIARCQRSGAPFSLLMIDLDHFKTINDRFGHRFGDQVLQAVSEVLRESIRSADLACRFGGEEFAVLLPGTPVSGAYRVAERIRQRVAALTFAPTAGKLSLSTSIGISECDSSRPVVPSQLVEEADRALYAGKHQGRNRTVLFPPGRTERAAETLPLRLDMAAGFA